MTKQVQSDAAWLTVAQVMRWENISRQEVWLRRQPGHTLFLVSKDEEGSVLIHAGSMTPDGRKRMRREVLQCAPPGTPETGQYGIFDATDVDRQIGALSLPRSERDLVIRRFRVIEPLFNHQWKALGYTSKGVYREAVAKANQTSARKIERWEHKWKRRENLIDLLDTPPGPKRGSISILDADMRTHLYDCLVIKKLKPGQCYDSLRRYLERKQQSAGCSVDHHYVIPSRPTVSRYLDDLSPIDHAARQGPDALKAACGHIKRTYRDIRSLDRVEVDEWKCDFVCYLANRPQVCKRFWLLTAYDERSMFPLVWTLVEGERFDKRHGITQEDEIALLVSLLREFGVPGALVSDRGRFRGNTFGGDRRFEEADGILDRFRIAHEMPRQKNPQSNRLERFHKFLADQSRTIPGWIGANDKERKMTPGDAQLAIHEQWLAGKAPRTPLLSTAEALSKINECMEAWRGHASEGTDMDGLSPCAVFERSKPAEGFRKPDEVEITLNTSEHREVTVRKGGYVYFDKVWYYHPQLANFQGECFEATRARHDDQKIAVLASEKPREVIVAPRAGRVGSDKARLAAEMKFRTGLRKQIGATVEPLPYEPGSQFSEPQTVQEAAPQAQAPAIAAETEREISSSEWMMENDRCQRQVKPLDFADLEY